MISKVVIFTEGGLTKGFGHITRCLSVYDAFLLKKITPKLIIDGDESIYHLIENEKFLIHNWINEINSLSELINNIDIAVFDSYFATEELYNHLIKRIKTDRMIKPPER